ncbi:MULTISPECIES: amino acid ABC transporter permease [Clostridium]|uniref:amino acid ABC transporter permease n=1 Tax=Clostridium TaxID=1485 RepID=UPI000825ED38|nr:MULTISPECIES: amino acid ABC transporter permease [Clostridium]PJI07604.1 amino acid ABC transporter permease [Clostridium sp. CT7]
MNNKIFDITYVFHSIPIILQTLPLTLYIMIISLILGFILGLIVTTMKLSKSRIIKIIANAYTAFIRGTPPLLQLLLIYYGLPPVLSLIGIDINNIDKSIFAVIAFALNSAAFMSEVMRSAYLAVDKGQCEAALSVGMTNFQMVRRIVFPQAFAIAVPSFGNITISLLKETSYVFAIGVIDILGKAKLIGSYGYGVRQLEAFIAVALIYWAVSILIEKSIKLYEYMHNNKFHKKVARGDF